eukprot:1741199-Rhodomonas_salina.2
MLPGVFAGSVGTRGVYTGKYYWEVTVPGRCVLVGVALSSMDPRRYPGVTTVFRPLRHRVPTPKATVFICLRGTEVRSPGYQAMRIPGGRMATWGLGESCLTMLRGHTGRV